MKRLLSIILTFVILTNCSDKPCGIDSVTKSTDLITPDTVKVYYKNDSINIWSINSENDPHPDTAIFFFFPENLFHFQGKKRVINIYYDKSFKSIAVTMYLNKTDTSYRYKRFDHNGTLRLDFARRMGKVVGPELSWYSNGKYKNKWHYKNLNRIADTSYYWSGELKKSSQYVNSMLFKQFEYYRDGQVSAEWIWEIPKNKDSDDYKGHNARFLIEYDSTTRFPKLFYLSSREEVTIDKEGSEITTLITTQIPVDSATIKSKTK